MVANKVLLASVSTQQVLWFMPEYFIPQSLARVPTFPGDFCYPIHTNASNWPENWLPDFLWNFIYGVVIAKMYGDWVTLDCLTKKLEEKYYPQDVKAAMQRAANDIECHKAEMEQKLKKQNKVRNERAKNRDIT